MSGLYTRDCIAVLHCLTIGGKLVRTAPTMYGVCLTSPQVFNPLHFLGDRSAPFLLCGSPAHTPVRVADRRAYAARSVTSSRLTVACVWCPSSDCVRRCQWQSICAHSCTREIHRGAWYGRAAGLQPATLCLSSNETARSAGSSLQVGATQSSHQRHSGEISSASRLMWQPTSPGRCLPSAGLPGPFALPT